VLYVQARINTERNQAATIPTANEAKDARRQPGQQTGRVFDGRDSLFAAPLATMILGNFAESLLHYDGGGLLISLLRRRSLIEGLGRRLLLGIIRLLLLLVLLGLLRWLIHLWWVVLFRRLFAQQRFIHVRRER